MLEIAASTFDWVVICGSTSTYILSNTLTTSVYVCGIVIEHIFEHGCRIYCPLLIILFTYVLYSPDRQSTSNIHDTVSTVGPSDDRIYVDYTFLAWEICFILPGAGAYGGG